ncbi:MAG: PQQ-binding-like beta-propeller repeat protein [Bacteroidales bacterium]
MKVFYVFLIVSFVVCPFLLDAQDFNGMIFNDLNSNGRQDDGEHGLANIRVSDGLNIVETNQDGFFSLPGWEKVRFITVYQPKNFACKDWYIPIDEGKRNKMVFAMTPKKVRSKLSFIQISDTETYEYRDWVNDLKEYGRINDLAFIIHTGDICYKRGIKWHADNVTTHTMGLPFYYCLGNHDLVAGDYGEQFYEQNFGPAWYAFEEGNTLFVITPMMGGDYKPSFTAENIGAWLQNLMNEYPQQQAKIVFNHTLLTDGDDFLFKYGNDKLVRFSDYNLKAWLYGHWHINMIKQHGDSGVTSYSTATAAKGGIDHSPSSFRVVDVDENGNTSSHFVWTFVDKQLTVLSPQGNAIDFDPNSPFCLSVNTYHSGAPVDKVRSRIWEKGKSPDWHDLSIDEGWISLSQTSDWNWQSKWQPEKAGKYTIITEALLKGGDVLRDMQDFELQESKTDIVLGGNWENLLGNPAHNGNYSSMSVGKMSMRWTANVGGNIFMTSPVIFDNKVFTARFDDGNAENCAIVALDAKTGNALWHFKTTNSVKNTIVIAQGLVIATDMQGFVYALNPDNGNLVWKKDLGYNRLPGYVSGMVSNGKTVFTGFGNQLCALDARTGNEIWRNKEWNGGEGAVPTLTLADGVLVASAHWRALYGHDASTGELLWKRDDDGIRFRDATLSFSDNVLWLTQNEKLFKLNPKTGSTIESFITGMNHTNNSAPIVNGNTVFVGSTDNGVSALDKNTGKRLWHFKTNRTIFHTPPYASDKESTTECSPLLLGNNLLVGAMDGNFRVLDSDDGKLVQEFHFGAPILSTPAVSGNCIFISDFAGNVSCLSW